MSPVMVIHIGGGLVALAGGTIAAFASKGGSLHARAGTAFFASMMVLAFTASILNLIQGKDPLNGVFPGYFLVTAWLAARNRDGRAGPVEIVTGLVAVGFAAVTVWAGVTGPATTPAGKIPLFIFAGVIGLGGILDFSVVLRRTLSARDRITRHLWRMCFAFFAATGSFFLGQQDAFPAAIRGHWALFLLAFAPFALMLFWLIRARFWKGVSTLGRPLGAQP